MLRKCVHLLLTALAVFIGAFFASYGFFVLVGGHPSLSETATASDADNRPIPDPLLVEAHAMMQGLQWMRGIQEFEVSLPWNDGHRRLVKVYSSAGQDATIQMITPAEDEGTYVQVTCGTYLTIIKKEHFAPISEGCTVKRTIEVYHENGRTDVNHRGVIRE